MKFRHIFTAAIIAVCLFCFAACKTEKDLTAPVPVLDGNVVIWEEVDGAEKYVVTVNGGQSETEETTYTLQVTDPGVYDIYVSAVRGEEKRTSEKLTYTLTAALAAPEITLSGNVVSWNTVENAKEYSVYVNGTLKTTTDKTRYTVDEEEAGEYAITVKANANGAYTESAASNSVTYKVEDADVNVVKLGTPEITLTKRTVSWNEVENAAAYKIYVNGAEYATVNGLNYTVTMRTAGSYEIAVSAVNPSSDYVESDKSDGVEFVIAPLDLTKPVVPYIVANGATAEYSEANGRLAQSGLWNDSGLDSDFITRAWRLIPAGEYYKIKLFNGAYLTSASGASYAWYEADSGSDGQLWEIRATDGGYHILNKAVGEYLFCSDNQSGLHFYHDVDSDVQKWNMFNTDVEFGADMPVLSAPVLSIEGNEVSWEEVDGATGYKVYVNGVYVETVEEPAYTIQAEEEMLYTVTVRATGEGVLDSIASNGVSYMHSNLSLSAPLFATYTATNGTTYAASTDGEGFVTMINAQEITDFTAYMWYLEEDGEFYKVKAANGYYLTRVANGDSAPEARLMPATGADNQLWKLVADGFNKYKLQNKEHMAQWGAGFFYGEWNGVFKFADACYGWDFVNKEISFGNVKKLSSPVISLDGDTASWAAVENATGYEIYVNGEKVATVTDTTYTLTNSGDALRVKAVAEGFEASYLSNSVTYTDLFANPVVAYYSRPDYQKLLKVNDDGTLDFSTDYSADIEDFSEYLWIMEKLDGGNYMIKLANGKYLSFSDNGNSVEAAEKDESSQRQQWILVPDGDSGTQYKLENVYFRNYYQDVYLGEWYGPLQFGGGCYSWTFFNP